MVYAYNIVGNSTNSNTVNVTTQACPPSVPGNLQLTYSGTSMNLTWAASTNHTGYTLQRKAWGEGSYSLLANLGAGAVSYTDNALNNCTYYSYRVQSYNGSGASAWSNIVAITTDGCANNQSLVVLPTADAFVYNNEKNSNFGSSSTIEIRGPGPTGSIYERKAYLKFNLQDVTETPNTAILRLKVSVQATFDPVTVGLHAFVDADDNWSEGSITWNNPPQAQLGEEMASKRVNSYNTEWFEWDITGLVKDELATKNGIVSLAVFTPQAPGYVRFSSKEGPNAPELVLGYSDGNQNIPPTCSITSPSNGSVVASGENIAINADASDTDGTVDYVTFFADGNNIGTDYTAPYTALFANAAAGTYALTCIATDNENATTTSGTVNITVNAAPACEITSPNTASVFIEGETISIAVNATDSENGIVSVEMFQNSALLATDNEAPYAYNWNGASPGSYEISALVTDNYGATGTCSVSNITVDPLCEPVSGTFNESSRNAQFNIVDEGARVKINNNGWIAFYGVNIGNYQTITAQVAANATNRSIEYRIGAADGQLLATLNISSTGSWDNFGYQTTDIANNPGGIHNLYVVGKGGAPACKLIGITLEGCTASEPVPVAPSTLGATATSSSQINLAWTDNSNNETGFRIER
ncbi:MAG: DNRLRE domain-containing protein [Bacteroidales bacterium]|nr:DNRLRE domain-containing protein [Bacteroidales bacterium]